MQIIYEIGDRVYLPEGDADIHYKITSINNQEIILKQTHPAAPDTPFVVVAQDILPLLTQVEQAQKLTPREAYD